MKIIVLLGVLLFFPTYESFSQTAIIHARPDQDLATKWSEALRQSSAVRADYWIGYSIERLMGESEFIGNNIRFDGGTTSGTFHGNLQRHEFIGKPLMEVLGEKNDNDLSPAVAKVSEKKVMKRIAILYLVRPNATIHSIQYGNLELPFELRSLPIVWLGEADPAQSVAHLTHLFETSQTKELKKDIISSVSLHLMPARVIPFAKKIISDESMEDELRKTAVYALGNQEDPSVVSFLKNLAVSESHSVVAKAACYALARIPGEGSFQALASLVRDGGHPEVRKAALYAIANHGGEQAKELLLAVVTNDPSEKLSKAALYALADLLEPNGSKVIYNVQRNAKSSAVKKAAIYALAEQEEPGTVDMLSKILNTEKDQELRKATVYALSQIETDKAITALLNVVAHDSDPKIRKAAIYALGEMESPKAKSALIEILKK